MIRKKKMDLNKFEDFIQNKDGLLVGGFSVTFNAPNNSVLKKNDKCQTINNCNGGNCVKGCGSTI